MTHSGENPFNKETIAAEILQDWQNLINIAAELLGVSAGLITRLDSSTFEIFLSSETEGNPYREGTAARFPGSGFFCEWVVKNKKRLTIPNALNDPQWKDNDAVALNMISYLGFPILRPDGEVFGTICFLSDKEKEYNQKVLKLVESVRRTIELSLSLVFALQEIEERDHFIQGLSRVFPICMYCKKVRNAEGAWMRADDFIAGLSGRKPSHGVCPECSSKMMKKIKRSAGK